MTGSWKGRGNQYIQFVRVLYCKLLTNSKQLPAFPLEAVLGIEPRPQRWEARVLPLCHRGPSATHHITLETYLQTFQYKLLNRLINCNFNLYKWKIKSEPYCDSCVIAIDTIEHHLFLCPLSKKFREEMEVWLNKQNNMPDRIQFTICEVIFGIGINQLKTSFYKFLNIFILFGKHYLNFCRTDKKY